MSCLFAFNHRNCIRARLFSVTVAAIASRFFTGTAVAYGFVRKDWRAVALPWPVSEDGQIGLRSEEFSALIHGWEPRAKKNRDRR